MRRKKMSKRLAKKLAYGMVAGSFNAETLSTQNVLRDFYGLDVTYEEADLITNLAADVFDRYRRMAKGWDKLVKEIVLKRGEIVLVSDEDYEWVKDYRLELQWGGYVRLNWGRKHVPARQSLHRAITERMGHDIEGMDVDHINGERLDNRRENLRVCTRSQNIANRGPLKIEGRTSPYKGVSWHARRKAWGVSIKLNQVMIHVGFYANEDDAAIAYNKAAFEAWGEFAWLNKLPEQDS